MGSGQDDCDGVSDVKIPAAAKQLVVSYLPNSLTPTTHKLLGVNLLSREGNSQEGHRMLSYVGIVFVMLGYASYGLTG